MRFVLSSSKAPDIVHQIPDFFGSNARFAVQPFHGRSQPIADTDKNFTVRRAVIPFVISQIRSLWLSSSSKLFRRFPIAMTCKAMALRAETVVEAFAISQRFRRRWDGILQSFGIWLVRA